MDRAIELKRQCILTIAEIASRWVKAKDCCDVNLLLNELAQNLHCWIDRDHDQLLSRLLRFHNHLQSRSFTPVNYRQRIQVSRPSKHKQDCVAFIARIASRGAASLDPDDINCTLESLDYLLYHYWSCNRKLHQLHRELEVFSPTADALTEYDKVGFAIRSTWN
jgi:hypothetical protein